MEPVDLGLSDKEAACVSARQSGHNGVMGEQRRASRDGALDALRAFAACCVALYHLSPSFVTYGSGG